MVRPVLLRSSGHAPLQSQTTNGIAMPVILDPSAAAVMKAFREANRPALDTLSPVEARAASALGRPIVQPDPPEMLSVETAAAPSPHGPIELRIFKPLNLPKLRPAALVFYHGGGWTI